MEIIFFVLFVALSSFGSDAVECETGWVAYKNQFCLKSFPSVLTYNEAKYFCTSQGNQVSKSTLVMVKDPEMQDLLANYTQDFHDYIWLGGKYDILAAGYKWDDGEPLTYTNWQEGYPRNITDSETCIELRPDNAKNVSPDADGKWADVHCEKRNMVMCQRQLSWTLGDAVQEIIKNRQELEAKLAEAANERDELRQQLETVSSRVVPVGSIYVEYYNQPSPTILWPSLAWIDVTNTYAGLFFRAQGGNSGAWGEYQSECAPRITQMDYESRADISYPHPINIPISGWSQFFKTGGSKWETPGRPFYEAIKLLTQTCEVRPSNQAIRIWKRTA